jgi:hypothetical protein
LVVRFQEERRFEGSPRTEFLKLKRVPLVESLKERASAENVAAKPPTKRNQAAATTTIVDF